uniref:COQ9 family protein n=1 Tax=Paracoccus binzhouensis TaxID=2796149 RepID=UPI0018EF28EE
RARLAAHPPQGRFRDRVAAAVMQRLALSDREMARAGAALLALPQNATLGARLLWETADTIWEALGDRSEDVNWYSKRATLSAVYGATALYWLGDDSPEQEATRDFLDRRIDGVMRFESFKGRVGALPGVSMLAGLATGWIRRPENRNLPGRLRPEARRGSKGGDG